MLVLWTGSVFPQSFIDPKHSSLPESLDARVKAILIERVHIAICTYKTLAKYCETPGTRQKYFSKTML